MRLTIGLKKIAHRTIWSEYSRYITSRSRVRPIKQMKAHTDCRPDCWTNKPRIGRRRFDRRERLSSIRRLIACGRWVVQLEFEIRINHRFEVRQCDEKQLVVHETSSLSLSAITIRVQIKESLLNSHYRTTRAIRHWMASDHPPVRHRAFLLKSS